MRVLGVPLFVERFRDVAYTRFAMDGSGRGRDRGRPPDPIVRGEIILEEVASRPIAAVHISVPVGQVAAAWRPALDEVWAFLRRHDGLRTDGHNIFVYRHPVRPGAPMEVDFGVEVSGPFPGDNAIVFTQTPVGHVASTIHLGSPDQLAAANAAIEDWCVANQRQLAGVSWEIYGDPGEDPAFLEVRVFSLLG